MFAHSGLSKIWGRSAVMHISAIALICIAGFGAPHAVAAESSWSISQSRFHVSVHGQAPCTECHKDIFDQTDPKAPQKIAGFCFQCHAGNSVTQERLSETKVPVIDISQYTASPHAKMSCLACHPDSAELDHAGKRAACLGCHVPHHEKVAHDIHAGIDCEACHIPDAEVVREHGSRKVQWRKGEKPGIASVVHSLAIDEKEKSCKRCHFSGNTVGAAAMVLPAKSIMCMPCHTATFSAGDTITRICLLLFLFGFFSVASVWMSGTLNKRNRSGIVKRIMALTKALFLDGLLQRRLYQQSRERWAIHALIFFPFVIRFTWGMVALCTSLWIPEWTFTWKMLDKNDPANAFLFDLTGIMVITGVALAVIRKARNRKSRLPGLPNPDWPAYGLLGCLFIVGFVLEGMRIAVTGSPEGAVYAFLGYTVSRLFAGADLTGIYGYIWYLHAILTGAFVIYLPFSRMFHLLMAPVSLAVRALSQHEPY
jgi:nitrate reductase gamma subunit